MRPLLTAIPIVLIPGILSTQVAATPPLIELQVADQTYIGKSLAHNRFVCWLAQQDGAYTEVPLADVSAFRKLEQPFRANSVVDSRNQLRRELGHGWEFAGSTHYLVCARNRQAQAYSNVFENLYGAFRRYFRTRGFSLPEPEFPLVAIVFPSVKDFAEYCQQDDLRFVPGLRGYYRCTTNRIVLFDPGEPLAVDRDSPWLSGEQTISLSDPLAQRLDLFPMRAIESNRGSVRLDASIQGDLANTLIHEGTHQIAYNLGLHSRIGDTPKWVIEGLATMFESHGARQNRRDASPSTRVNVERLEWYREYVQKRRSRDSLARFLSDDQMFSASTLDAYAQAWALTFFLAETRGTMYSAYIRRINERDPLAPYGPQERLEDFQEAFGTDIPHLEISFLRFMNEIE